MFTTHYEIKIALSVQQTKLLNFRVILVGGDCPKIKSEASNYANEI